MSDDRHAVLTVAGLVLGLWCPRRRDLLRQMTGGEILDHVALCAPLNTKGEAA